MKDVFSSSVKFQRKENNHGNRNETASEERMADARTDRSGAEQAGGGCADSV
jgi:hypothetical protein